MLCLEQASQEQKRDALAQNLMCMLLAGSKRISTETWHGVHLCALSYEALSLSVETWAKYFIFKTVYLAEAMLPACENIRFRKTKFGAARARKWPDCKKLSLVCKYGKYGKYGDRQTWQKTAYEIHTFETLYSVERGLESPTDLLISEYKSWLYADVY